MSSRTARMRMRMSDSSGQEAVMSQRAKRRSLSVPGSRPARSNPGLPVPTSVSNRSNPSPGDSAFRPHALHRQIHDPACSESPRVVGHCSLQGTGPKRCFEPKVVMQAGQARASPPRSSINSISSIDRRRSATYRSGVDSFSAWACWTLVALRLTGPESEEGILVAIGLAAVA